MIEKLRDYDRTRLMQTVGMKKKQSLDEIQTGEIWGNGEEDQKPISGDLLW